MEFVILFPLFLLIIVGIVEFGHLFYVRHTLTNASREGARAAVVYYYSDRPTGKLGQKMTAKDAVDKYLPGYQVRGHDHHLSEIDIPGRRWKHNRRSVHRYDHRI